MDIRQITPRFYAAPQISAEDMPELAAAGIALIICNRPDAEVPPSHQADAIRKAAEAAGIAFAVQPLTHQTMTPDVIARNKALADAAEGPVLAYCASGTRSTIAWALGCAGDMPVDDIIAAARQGGYDLSNLRPALEGHARG
ncbi:TIGR01244 family sulfur transferase [Sulfitobacter sp. LCG007]